MNKIKLLDEEIIRLRKLLQKYILNMSKYCWAVDVKFANKMMDKIKLKDKNKERS